MKRNLRFLPLALVFGPAAGLFVNGYWLSSAFPAGSRQLLLLTALIALIASAAYWLLLAWGAEHFAALSPRLRLAGAGVSLLAGALLLFGGTEQWRSPPRYLTFLLPTHHLQLQVSRAPAPGDLALTWFNTSLGDVSYDMLNTKGWKRAGDELILEDPDSNSLEWNGRTGETAQLMFRSAQGGADLRISWDSESGISHVTSGKFASAHEFQVPWYASSWFVLALGILSWGALALMLFLLLWQHRAEVASAIRESAAPPEHAWDRRDAIFMLAALILALLLRLPDLGKMYPAVDEYFHLIAARQIAEGAALSSVYDRSLWLVTLPVSLAFRVFGFHLWAARLVGAVFNVLAIWPLYLLGRAINRPVAALSVLLFAASPWIVTFARITREYAYYPFFAYWIVLGMLAFLRRFPERFVLLRDWKAMLAPRMLLLEFALLLPPMFAFYIDPSSTFRVMMLAYIVFAAFLLARFDWTDRQNLPVFAMLGAAMLAAGYLAYRPDTGRIVAVPRFNPVPVEYFAPNPPQQWYFDRLPLLAVLALIAAAACSYVLRRVNAVPLFLLCLFLTYLAFFAFLSKTFFHTRHLSTTELWYIVLLASGIYYLWRVLQPLHRWDGRPAHLVLGAVLAISLVNPGQILQPITSTNPDNAISEDYLHDMSRVHAFMLAHAQPRDVLISTVYGLYSSWMEQPHFRASFRITTETPRDEIMSLIDQHESGWIVIDQIRLDMSTLGPRGFAGNPDVEYIGLFGDQNVWHWQHAAGGFGNTMVAGKAQ